jgi:hypothetical protein
MIPIMMHQGNGNPKNPIPWYLDSFHINYIFLEIFKFSFKKIEKENFCEGKY